jgi:hypothetical protein
MTATVCQGWVLVARSLALDATRASTTAHVRAGARAGGNAATLHRHLKEAGGEVASLASLYRVVRRDLEGGRVLPDRAVVRACPGGRGDAAGAGRARPGDTR